MKCPICDKDYLGNVKRKGVVFRKKRFPELKGDMWICKKCNHSQAESSLVNELKVLDPEKIYDKPMYPERVIDAELSAEERQELEREQEEIFDEVWEPGIRTVLSILGAAAIVGGIILFGWQTYTWLKSGTWVALPLNYVVNKQLKGTKFLLWLTNPKSWYGLNRIVTNVLSFPASGGLFLGGMALVALPVRLWLFLGSIIAVIIFLVLI